MNPRNALMNRQGFACSISPDLGRSAVTKLVVSVNNYRMLRCFTGECTSRGPARVSRSGEVAARGAWGGVFRFSLWPKKLDSATIKTLKRGFAACVNQPFLSRQSQHLPLRAVSTTPIPPQIMPQCAPLVARPQARSLLMQPAAAKPKARLSVRWWAACRAACRACQTATDTGPNTGLTSPLKGGVIHSTRSFGVAPGWPFRFCTPRVLLRKGCYV